MLNTPKGVIATLAIQCKSASGGIGDFIFFGHGTPSKSLTLSPVFSDLASLLHWLKIHDWEALPYDINHPTGQYIKR